MYDHLMRTLDKLDDFLLEANRTGDVQLDADVDIVLSVGISASSTGEDEQIVCSYYLISHEHRVVFWLDPFEASSINVWWEVNGAHEPSHISMCFW